MVRYIIVLLSALLLWQSASPSPAQAQTACGERSDALFRLEKDFSEAPVAMGLASNGSVIEVFASKAGTFTIIMTRPDGVSCLMLSGENWEELPAQLAGAKS
ncbi:MAG: hypothetical protein A3G18_10350 [Rhodospirillales bacterium RIFCSPLOWO2_12_FULL_58_28]|nr:MAG: hypothetical protein A3H92_08525 [Rhodospirillales bacterium RIFCSPLOWO2_02_FULL_58_16]OHC77708.1 MAG: hypothetical protein A3G18_10350 [Rhodospirillales bacterium RIFCSPLOWO2_12_FULL_58_28]